MPSPALPSENPGSTLRNPAKVLAMIGNTDTMNADTATARSPGPNHSTSNGATATIGTVCKNSAYGYSPRSSQRDKEKAKPTVVPRLALSKNPSTAPCAVVSNAPASGARSVHTALSTSDGGGTKKRGTEKARTTPSQSTITIAKVSAGGKADDTSARADPGLNEASVMRRSACASRRRTRRAAAEHDRARPFALQSPRSRAARTSALRAIPNDDRA